jgi:hypothetical protein
MKVINKGGTDKTVIMAVREFLPQRFQATGWTDLRIGFLLSVCGFADPGSDDTITGLTEEIGTPPRPPLGAADRYFIGLLDSATGTIFAGFTNTGSVRPFNGTSQGTSKLVSGDKGIGTSNNNYWRPKNEIDDNMSVAILDASGTRARSADGSQIHFAQANIGGAGPAGYATLLMLRLQRDNATNRSKIITISTKKDTTNHNADTLFTNTPTSALLASNLPALPVTAQTLGPIQLSQELDTLYLYWPFTISRLRIHAMGILKAA